MSLTSRWKSFFRTDVRHRGRAYQREGRVELLEPRRGEAVRAQVRGSELYTVVIGDGGDFATARCTCEHFASGHYCKHLWAVLLEVSQREMLDDHDTTALDQAGAPRLPKARKRDGVRTRHERGGPEWLDRLTLLRQSMAEPAEATAGVTVLPSMVYYLLSATLSQRAGRPVVVLRQRQPTRQGLGTLKPLRLSSTTVMHLASPADREIVSLLMGATPVLDEYLDEPRGETLQHEAFTLPRGAARSMLKRMIDTGRCHLHARNPLGTRAGDESPQVLRWGGGEPWVLWLVGVLDDAGDLTITAELRRGSDTLAIDKPALVLGGDDGVIIIDDRVDLLDDQGAGVWMDHLRDGTWGAGSAGKIVIPAGEIETFLDRLYRLPQLPPMQFPPGVGRWERPGVLTPSLDLVLGAGGGANGAAASLGALLWFNYEERRVDVDAPGRFVNGTGEADRKKNGTDESHDTTLMRRDRIGEQQAIDALYEMGFKPEPSQGAGAWSLWARRMPEVVTGLLRRGWQIRADQQILSAPSTAALSITSGMDWFELHGGVRYTRRDGGEQVVTLPQILQAVRAGRNMVALDDGSQGMLPEQWLAQHGLLAALGRIDGDHLRFSPAQAAMLDRLIEPDELINIDARFAEVRERLHSFDGIEPAAPADSFKGELRPYQREGVGWLRFLAWLGAGGILADDMGLGKTVQVLAHVERRAMERDAKEPKRPTIVVAPKSVVYNWIDEAHRFTPSLSVLNYSGADRDALLPRLAETDLIVTSYGLLRRDLTALRKIEFDYVILDEAQAIKNPLSKSAKAARSVNARHRLALTGTPVENHLGDLWSIFEFLNPGMLGSGTKFAEVLRGSANDPTKLEAAQQAGRALRPFILRRTKSQVLTDLPEKTEQTIVCEMEPAQRKVYNELRDYYRAALLGKAGAGLNGGQTMVVLEALLRLRQAACHPALIDEKRRDEPSAKLDALIEQLAELIDEGHKALVFSQFTSMLALVRRRLDELNVTYEYLDGQTVDRKRRVDRFQHDPACPLFLISLKAGGLGLNLTAAQYVFILDPWWNPAVEAQAIDRAHRIGQTRAVTAYRLVCSDTVEQRIIELQDRKRQLADAIVGGQENILRDLTREDLEQLLS